LPQPAIAFRPLALTDLDALTLWLNRPHLRRFFQKTPTTGAEVEAKYAPRILGTVPTHCHLAIRDAEPFATLQCYRVADWPDWARTTGERDGIGVDLAIFEPTMIGQGLGRALLRAYLLEIAFPLFPDQSRCFIAHQLENTQAIAASRAAGFQYLRDFAEENFQNALLVFERGKNP
jgi:aminoglycoside 6'-N-acetyltransferase